MTRPLTIDTSLISPEEAQEAKPARRRGASLTQQEKVNLALALLRDVVASVAHRCPKGFRPYEADALLTDARLSVIHSERMLKRWEAVAERVAGNGKGKV